MEGEINNLILVWTTVVASLCYCHKASQLFPSGLARILAILPISILFSVLPLNLTSIHLGGTTSFFIAWLANFKLILFAFNHGPLSSNPPIPLSRFIPLACFPIKFQESREPREKKTKKGSYLSYATKITLLAVLQRIYDYRERIHPHIILLCYCLHIYFALEMILALVADLAKALSQIELEPQFNKPHLATSLQDFWGRRWNLIVSNILRPTIYKPVRSVSAPLMTRKWVSIPGVLATFLVSGLMHELIFYNFGRVRPSGEVTCFFLLHGVSVSVEIVVKKLLDGRFQLPGIVSGPLTLAYVIYTSFWLFFPPYQMAKGDLKACKEFFAFIESVKTGRLVDPNDVVCPYL